MGRHGDAVMGKTSENSECACLHEAASAKAGIAEWIRIIQR
jgi:hypothetical protein